MKCYAVAEIAVEDSSWLFTYFKHVTPMVEAVGGKYLARTSDVELVEGAASGANSFLIIEFPSRDAALEFYHSREYQPYKDLRQKGSSGRFYLVAGEDVANLRGE